MTDLASGPLDGLAADLLVLPVEGDGPDAWADRFGEPYRTARADAQASKEAAVVIRAGEGPRRLAVVAVGEEEGAERWRWAAAQGAAAAARIRAERVVLAVPPGEGVETAAALAEGFGLAAYRFDHYRTGDPAPTATVAVHTDAAGAREALDHADVCVEATAWARDLVNLGPDEKVPDLLANLISRTVRPAGLRVEIWDKERIHDEKMGGLLGVNRGSVDPPRFVILEWVPEGHEDDAPVVLVGKAVTYDTGGLSLKPTKDSMDKMKADMAGGAAVAGAMLGVARLGLPLRVVALLPMSDNRPGGRAYAPGDVLRMHGGQTVEVLNTDAEGRLLLADALSYARRYAPRWVADLATLTGAQGVALGERVAAVVARPEDEPLADRVRRAGTATGDLAWPLPLFPHYRDQLKSDVADLKNVGGSMAGTITAGAFLEAFTHGDDGPAYPWVHVDLARPAFLDAAYGYRPKGGTGFGVRLLLDVLTDEASRS